MMIPRRGVTAWRERLLPLHPLPPAPPPGTMQPFPAGQGIAKDKVFMLLGSRLPTPSSLTGVPRLVTAGLAVTPSFGPRLAAQVRAPSLDLSAAADPW